MANPEHVKLLKKSVDEWNAWRKENPLVRPNLSGADLSWTKLFLANLNEADPNEVDLRMAKLIDTLPSEVDFRKANLSGADLILANFNTANLSKADLTRAGLLEVNFTGANLSGANFTEATMGMTIFADVDLSEVKGLDTVEHIGPSSIGIDTIYKSKGKIPEVFLRKAGVPRALIEYIPDLVAAQSPIKFYSCFISYNHQDEEFTERLYADLQNKDVRCWKYTEDMKIGDKIRSRIDASIRIYDKLLLILSKDSIASDWVETEVETAFEKEQKAKRKNEKHVLFPIRVDESIMRTRKPWAANIRRTRHIGDFRNWKDHDEYKKAFDRLLSDLAAE